MFCNKYSFNHIAYGKAVKNLFQEMPNEEVSSPIFETFSNMYF